MKAYEQILGHEYLVSIFGYWPSFHDGTVEWFRLDRRDSALGPGPTLEVMIHTFQTTDESDASGALVLRDHVLVYLRFGEAFDFSCDSFYRDYYLMEMYIAEVPDDAHSCPVFQIHLDSVYGEEGIHFKCRRMEVVSVVRCDAAGNPGAS